MQSETKQRVAIDLARELLDRDVKIVLETKGLSMGATLRTGDRILLQRAQPDTLVPGQIVAFQTRAGLTAHRILRTWKTGGNVMLQTKGDASVRPDPPLAATKVIGCVASIGRGTHSIGAKSTAVKLADLCQLHYGRLLAWIGQDSRWGQAVGNRIPRRCARALLLLPALIVGHLMHHAAPDWRSRNSL